MCGFARNKASVLIRTQNVVESHIVVSVNASRRKQHCEYEESTETRATAPRPSFPLTRVLRPRWWSHFPPHWSLVRLWEYEIRKVKNVVWVEIRRWTQENTMQARRHKNHQETLLFNGKTLKYFCLFLLFLFFFDENVFISKRVAITCVPVFLNQSKIVKSTSINTVTAKMELPNGFALLPQGYHVKCKYFCHFVFFSFGCHLRTQLARLKHRKTNYLDKCAFLKF